MRKSHSNGYTLSLSGGADSTACACLIKFMHDFGIEELGKDKFIEKSGMKFSNKENLMKDLLICIYQSTENSSKVTFNSAEAVAKAIDATFLSWSVSKIINNYESNVQRELNINLSWENNDIALQNIQARVRIPGLWMVANIKNALLICTSNRSEAAVGYSTADGDLSGSLCPVGGIDKYFLLKWLNWIYSDYAARYYNTNNQYGNKQIWVNSLEKVLFQLKPTAELRPIEMNQSDESDLMSYEILDAIECLAIVQKKSPKEVFEYIKIQFGTIDHETIRSNVNKFFKLWSRNQWKRQKMPVSFMLDEECLDPKTFCRFPILSAHFEEI